MAKKNEIKQWEMKQRSYEVKRAMCREYSRSIIREMSDTIRRESRRFTNDAYLTLGEKAQERQMRRIVEKRMAQAAHKTLTRDRVEGRYEARMVKAYTAKCLRNVMVS